MRLQEDWNKGGAGDQLAEQSNTLGPKLGRSFPDLCAQQYVEAQLSIADGRQAAETGSFSSGDLLWSPQHAAQSHDKPSSYVEERTWQGVPWQSPAPDRDVPHDLGQLRSMGIVAKRLAASKDMERGCCSSEVQQRADGESCKQDGSDLGKQTLHGLHADRVAVPAWVWYAVMLLSMAVAFISYVDRAILSVTIIPMASELGFSASTEGFVRCACAFACPCRPDHHCCFHTGHMRIMLSCCSAAFFYGYTVSNIFAGYLAMRYSAKTVLGAGVWIWSVFTVLTPSAARSSQWALLVARFMMGLGEGDPDHVTSLHYASCFAAC